MDVVSLNADIQVGLYLLIACSIAVVILGIIKDSNKVYLVGTILMGVFGVMVLWRSELFVEGGYTYANTEDYGELWNIRAHVEDESFVLVDSDKLAESVTDREELENALPYDRVEFSLKEDLSEVGFLDVLLCRNYKWLEGKVVKSSAYKLFKGKDAELLSKKRPGRRFWDLCYIKYDGELYLVPEFNFKRDFSRDIFKRSLFDDSDYILVYDSLSEGIEKIDGESVKYKLGMLKERE